MIFWHEIDFENYPEQVLNDKKFSEYRGAIESLIYTIKAIDEIDDIESTSYLLVLNEMLENYRDKAFSIYYKITHKDD